MFSPAESKVVAYLNQGFSNKTIAEMLMVEEKTVKFHLTSIFKKSGVKSRTEFIAQQNGIISDREAVVNQVTKTNNTVVVQKSQEDKVNFIDQKFRVGETVGHLHKMMTEVTKEEINPATVNAACNCVARLNETIHTAIQAARFLNEK